MKAPVVRFSILSLLLIFLASACSHTPSKPQFRIAAADLAARPVLGTNSAPSGEHATIVVRLQFSAAKAEAFQKFTREHKNQQAQLVVRAKVVAEPFIVREIPGGQVELAFWSFDEAREVRDWLSAR